MRMFLTAALAALALACTPLSAAWAACASDDAACQRAELTALAGELNTIADNFRDRGNAGAERKWRSAALAVEGNDGGISLADARSWLAASNRNGWGTGQRLLPKVIAAIESLPVLIALEAQQAKQQGQGDDPPPGQFGEGSSQQAEIVFDGTIPVHSEWFHDRTPASLTVRDDGVLDTRVFRRPRLQTAEVGDLPDICLDPAKGCDTTGRKVRNRWAYTSGQKGQAFTRTYTSRTVYRWSDGFECTVGADCRSKTNSNSNGGVRLSDGGYKYSTGAWWNYVRQNKRNPARTCPTIGHSTCSLDEWIPDPDKDASARPWIVGTFGTLVPTLHPGRDVERWFVAARKNGENDYTSFGYWSQMDFHSNRHSDPRYVVNSNDEDLTVFAGGTNPATDISGVTGTATYRGEAAGIVLWRDNIQTVSDRAARFSTYDRAPVAVTADFDAMTLDTTIDLAHRVQEAPGCIAATGCVSRWTDVGPEIIRFRGVGINSDGTFRGGRVSVQGEMRVENGRIPEVHPAEPDQSMSDLDGRFYVPDGNNAPGQALGTFEVLSDTPRWSVEEYRVYGAFGTEKQ